MIETMFKQDPADALEWRSPDGARRDGTREALQAIRDIAVVVTRLPGDAPAVDFAVCLAHRASARLEVVHVVAMPVTAAEAWLRVPDLSLVERLARLRQEAAGQANDLTRRIASLGAQGEVHTIEALYVAPPNLAAAHVRRTDLVVMGRPAGASPRIGAAHTYFAGLLLESGRPVIVVPDDAPVRFPPRYITVAWADRPEAARAVHDALPFLEEAETVDVVVVDATANEGDPALTSAERIVEHLRGHGVHTHLITCSSRGAGVGGALLKQATRRHAQLLVAGGYGHGRLREWALGGTTRALFMGSAIPVFFSH